jgi:hypothetical protein
VVNPFYVLAEVGEYLDGQILLEETFGPPDGERIQRLRDLRKKVSLVLGDYKKPEFQAPQ